MNIVRSALLFVCALVTFSGVSIAEEQKLLERSEVAAFLGTPRVLHSLSEEMKAAGVGNFYKFDSALAGKTGMPIFVENIRIMRENTPEYYDRFTAIVTSYSHKSVNGDPVYRFEDAEDWAQIGDRVLLAHFTENSPSSRTSHDFITSRLPPGIMKMMKPEARAKAEESLGLLRSAQDVPLFDKRLVATFEDEIVDVLYEMR